MYICNYIYIKLKSINGKTENTIYNTLRIFNKSNATINEILANFLYCTEYLRYLRILCRNPNRRRSSRRRIPLVGAGALQGEDALAASGVNVTGNSM